ncbi:coiled-coil and C2 domain-containing protein 1B-like isoform X2 [Myxocyprinus asiaticus]|uniref:coiled-coil and C2 domain-containing protein 1B-like isoform X2 n=2 Tax=Myxocyprinus asiaticus TaxID=70543 RepID=UPI0022219A5A|nr:coiled-coil and C2 domain-containing protein 1B-like isoform X2 [Myxocyprinus asiaticus]
MFGRKNKRAAPQKGQGAAAAKQMGLLLDFKPDDMMVMDQDMDDPDLEAEFAAIVGKKPLPAATGKKAGKAPLPMEDIAKMAEACMKDVDDDDDDNLEDDEDLLAELQEVVEEEEIEDSGAAISSSHVSAKIPSTEPAHQVSSVPGSIEHTLEERINMYKMAIANAKSAGESSKARRYERGLKTLQTMLVSARKGGKTDETEIPPPVACGASSGPDWPLAPPATSPDQHGESDSAVEISPVSVETVHVVMDPAPNSREESSGVTSPASLSSPEEEHAGHAAESSSDSPVRQPTKDILLERQREYRMAAVKAKQAGDIDQAKMHVKASKRATMLCACLAQGFDAAIEALEKGQSVDMSSLPPSLTQVTRVAPQAAVKVSTSAPEGQADNVSGPAQPKTILEALEQRMAKYKEAFTQAKASGDDRKARMHDRITKQYQAAIRAHKAGRAVNYDELPAPPGFPPIPGQKATSPEQGLDAVLEMANKLTSNEADAGAEEEAGYGEEKVAEKPCPVLMSSEIARREQTAKVDNQKKPTLAVQPMVQEPKRTPSPDRTSKRGSLPDTSQQLLEFLEGRKKQYMKAALQAKQKNDLEQAKTLLRTAKGLDPLIEAVCSGKTVDISKVPSLPGDEDFILVHHSDVRISEKAEEVYTQLNKLLKEQHEKCVTYSKQFTHMGNVAETTKFEKMAEQCKKSLEILKLAHNRGLQPPKHHFEERTYRTVRIFPELSSTDMVVVIVRGMNLPAPSGVASNDLDAYVKFEFPYPSSDQPQKHKTSVIKNTNNPEYNQNFKLNINRNHRGFRRVVQSKGLKLEVLHKGGFLRSDKPVGTANLKLEKLEAESELREIVEVMDGRKATGGRLEVRVRLREPLSGQDIQTITERWLVLEEPQVLL